MKEKIVILLTSLLMTAGMRGFSQETSGSMKGKTLDSLGSPLAGASIEAIHEPSGTRYTTTSSSDGYYYFSGLRVGGPYRLNVSYAGLEEQSRNNLFVTLGNEMIANFKLSPRKGALESVTVRGQRAGPRSLLFGAGNSLGRERISTMPTITRSITDITKLVPQGSRDNSFLGSNFRYNNVTIDGAINNDAIGFSPSAGGITGSSNMPGSSTRTNSISLDAIQEVQVFLAPYDVKIGNFTGGSINAVTRSGTNEVHGSIYAYGRNATIVGKETAGDGSAMPSSFYDYQTGFSVGFPLVKNKLFLFTNEEHTDRRDPVLLAAGSANETQVLSLADAKMISNAAITNYSFDPGSYDNVNIYSTSDKLFNRIDWNLDEHNQFSLRNNTIFSKSTNLERDQQDFRFSSINYQQVNTQTSTVAELKTKVSPKSSNSAIIGYTAIHDSRNPSSNAAFPQVQIVGRTPGTTIFFGTDREAAIFDLKQHTLEISDNLTLHHGAHTITVGTHNELYGITYNFVNSWNGRVDYLSIDEFLSNNPYRVRGSYNYTDNSRPYILSHPSAQFNINFYSAYVQDEIRLSDKFTITPGFRIDYVNIPTKQILSDKVKNARTDPFLGNTFDYTPLNEITQHYLDRPQASPRLGFRYDVLGNQALNLKGGLGVFTGRIPFAWLGYAFYNNGDTYGAYDQKRDQKPFASNSNALKPSPDGIRDFVSANGYIVNNKNAGKTQVDLVDNHFVMPQVFRASFSADYTNAHAYKFELEAIFTEAIKDVKFQQVNLTDHPQYYLYDSASRQQPLFSGSVDPAFSNAYEMSNTTEGYRYSLTATVSKRFVTGFNFSASYTFGHSKDVSNGIRNSMESNWQLNQALNPNSAGLATSNFDIPHRIIASLGFNKVITNIWATSLSMFFSAQSGSPLTYGFVNYSVQGTPQQVSLAYIPRMGESINFFGDLPGQPAAQQAKQFDDFIGSNEYLRSRRGYFTERNGGRTPWNTRLDFHASQQLYFFKNKSRFFTIAFDILNLTNMLNSNWGWSYFSPNTFNSTASIGLQPYQYPREAGGYPIYTFSNPGKPYSVDLFDSRWQMQLGIRYNF